MEEKEFELVIKEKNLGSLTTNAKAIKESVEKALSNYKAENYDESNIDDAKKDKALLNNTSNK